MPNLRINSLEGRALLDIGSFARPGPSRRDRLLPEDLALIGRTVRRTPEVMVKVLSKDGNSLRSVVRHLNYIGRTGDLELETDDGERLQERGAGQRLVSDWDLDLDQNRPSSQLSAGFARAPKLVHKMMLSMPPGTPPKAVLEAARNFAREEFALRHRYVLALHTNEAHPHVHLVVKAVSEQGERLNIRKATLREWRSEFARYLRDQGISANATERAVRGERKAPKKDGIYRAALRGDSRHMRNRLHSVASELRRTGEVMAEEGKRALCTTRRNVKVGWSAASKILANEGHPELAAAVRRFVHEMPLLQTEREMLAAAITDRTRVRSDPSTTR